MKSAITGLGAIALASAAWGGPSAAADAPSNAPTGYIVLSITSGGANMEVDLLPADGGPALKITGDPGGVFGGRGDFKLPKEEIKSQGALDGTGMHYMKEVDWRGVVIVKAVPAGDYILSNIGGQQTGGVVPIRGAVITTGYRTNEKLNRTISVSPGRATYIGEYKSLYLAKKNIIGMEGWYGFRYVVSDQSARDLPIAHAKQPDLGEVDIAIPPVDDLHLKSIGSKP
jgi:hypothetical protein